MEGAPFKRGKILKEDCNERSNIPGCFLGGTLNCGKERRKTKLHEDIAYN
jgi:hypothetical protein